MNGSDMLDVTWVHLPPAFTTNIGQSIETLISTMVTKKGTAIGCGLSRSNLPRMVLPFKGLLWLGNLGWCYTFWLHRSCCYSCTFDVHIYIDICTFNKYNQLQERQWVSVPQDRTVHLIMCNLVCHLRHHVQGYLVSPLTNLTIKTQWIFHKNAPHKTGLQVTSVSPAVLQG